MFTFSKKSIAMCFSALFLTVSTQYSEAVSSTWDASTNSDLLTALNWTPATVPTETATFDSTAGSFNPTLGNLFPLQEFLFPNVSPQVYTFNINSSGLLGFLDTAGSAIGVTNTNGLSHVINVNNGGRVSFQNSSSAAIANAITYNLSGNGEIQFIDTSHSGLANFVFNSTTSQLNFFQTANSSVDGSISGTGGSSPSTAVTIDLDTNFIALTSNAAQTYTGNTNLKKGVLLAGGTNTLPQNSDVVMTSNSALSIANFSNTIGSLAGTGGTVSLTTATLTLGGTNASTTFSGNIGSGAGGALTKIGTGTFTLGAFNNYSGTTTLSAGTLQAGAANVFSPNSNVALSIGATLDANDFNNIVGAISGLGGTVDTGTANLTFGNANSTTYAGIFVGSGTLNSQGSGTFNYTGNSAGYTGTTNIGNSQFALNGTLGGNVFVNSGATLSGNSNIGGNLKVNSGATISPGNSIGVINAANYIQDANSTYVVEINGLGQSDRIDVSGIATLNGGTVNVISLGGYNINTNYLILNAAGGVTGAFQGVTAASISTMLQPQLIYTPTEVFLELQTQIINVACTNNTAQVARQLDDIQNPSPELSTFLNGLIGITPEQACVALNEMTGQQYSLALMSAEINGRQFLRRLYDPLRSIVTTIPCNCCCDPCCCNSYAQFKPWIEAGGGRSIIDGNKEVKGLKLNEWEISGGFQGTCNEFTLGLAGSYVQDQIDFNLNGTGKSKTGYGALYGLYRPSGWYVFGDVAYGYTQNSIKRHIDIGDLHYSARGKNNINQVIGYIEGGFDLNCKCLLIQPFLGFEGGYYYRNGFKEHGADPLNLSINSKQLTKTYTCRDCCRSDRRFL